jgi:hypothetical protein
MKVSFLLVSALAAADAFTAPMPMSKSMVANRFSSGNVDVSMAQENEESTNRLPALSAVTAAVWAMTSTSAMAAGPDWGIFEGKTLSLLHPVMMASLLGFSVSTALLGFQWRRQRTIGDEISSLKKSIPALGEYKSVSEALTAAMATDPREPALIAKLQAAVPVDAQIKEIQVERKELAEKAPKDKHFSQGTLLVLAGTVFAIEVCKT